MDSNSNAISKKVFNFYYDMTSQKLAVYTGTPQSEIKESIYELFNIPSNKKINILDEDGIPVVLSSYLPDGVNVYVQIQKSFTEKFFEGQVESVKNEENVENVENTELIEEDNPTLFAGLYDSSTLQNTQPVIDQYLSNYHQPINWVWLEPKNSSHMLKNGNKTVYQPKNLTMSSCKGLLIMENGEYYYTLLIEPLQCCVCAFVYPFNEEFNCSELETLDMRNSWPEHKSKSLSYNSNDPVVEAGFYINMERHLLILYDHKNKTELVRKQFKKEWTKVCPVVYFKHEVAISITSDALRYKPEWVAI